jgi:hypothetical protein
MRRVEIVISEADIWKFADLLKEFGTANGFSFSARDPRRDQKHITVYLVRKDVELVGTTPFKPGEINIGFFAGRSGDPISATDLDVLVEELRRVANMIGGSTFSITW